MYYLLVFFILWFVCFVFFQITDEMHSDDEEDTEKQHFIGDGIRGGDFD